MCPYRFCNTLLHFRPLQVWLGAFLHHPTALFRVANRAPVVFAVLYVTFASSQIPRKRICNTLQCSGAAPGPFCNTLQHFWLRANFAIPYCILGPRVANLQYPTALQRRPKLRGRDFAIPYCVCAPSFWGVSHFCNTLQHSGATVGLIFALSAFWGHKWLNLQYL